MLKKYFVHIIILIIFFSDPYIWLLAFTPNYRVVNVVLILISIIYLFTKKITLSSKDKAWLGTFIVSFIYILVHGSYFSDSAQIVISIGLLLKILFLLAIIYFIKKDEIKIVTLFFKYNMYAIYGGLVLFFILLIGIELPSIEFSQTTGIIYAKDLNWLYPLGVVDHKFFLGNFIFTRMCGLTDEPGQLGLLITWLLILNEFTIKSKKTRNILMIAGIFTFSLGYFISLSFFTLYIIYNSNRKQKILKYIFTGTVLIIFIFAYLPTQIKNKIEAITINRLEISEGNNRIEGDNRSEAISAYYHSLKKQERLLFGLGTTNARKEGIARLFGNYGFLGLLFIYYPVLYLLFSKRIRLKHKYLILIILFNLIQRPGINYIFQMVVLTFIYYSTVIQSKHLIIRR